MTHVLPSTFGRRSTDRILPFASPPVRDAAAHDGDRHHLHRDRAAHARPRLRPLRLIRSNPQAPARPGSRSRASVPGWCATSRPSTGCAPWPCWPCSPTTGRRRGCRAASSASRCSSSSAGTSSRRCCWASACAPVAPTSRPFWIRRARRLLPALYTLLVVVSAVWLIWHPSEVAGLRGAVAAAAAYVSNWYLIAVKQSYFESVARPSPVLHLWSLAVEEQFYLIWPLALAGLVRTLPPTHAPGAAWPRCALAAGSAVLGMVLYHPGRRSLPRSGTAPTRVPPASCSARPWPSPCRRGGCGPPCTAAPPSCSNVLAVVALAGVVWMFVHVNEFDPFVYRGGFVLLDLLTVALILSLVHPASTLVSRAMSVAPLVWIGRRSYGIYLWHWPIFVVTRPGLDVSFGGWRLLGLRLGATLVAAELSYRFVELPVRNGSLNRWLRAVARRRGARRADIPIDRSRSSLSRRCTRPGDHRVDRQRPGRPWWTSAQAGAGSDPGGLGGGHRGGGGHRHRTGAGQARGRPPPGLDLRGVVHDKLGDVISDGPGDHVATRVGTSSTTAAPTTTAPAARHHRGPATGHRSRRLPPIVPVPGDQLVAVGDSVLLGARGWVRQQFPGVLINAVVGRQFETCCPSLLFELQASGAAAARGHHRPRHQRPAHRCRPGQGARRAGRRPEGGAGHHPRAAVVAGRVEPAARGGGRRPPNVVHRRLVRGQCRPSRVLRERRRAPHPGRRSGLRRDAGSPPRASSDGCPIRRVGPSAVGSLGRWTPPRSSTCWA